MKNIKEEISYIEDRIKSATWRIEHHESELRKSEYDKQFYEEKLKEIKSKQLSIWDRLIGKKKPLGDTTRLEQDHDYKVTNDTR